MPFAPGHLAEHPLPPGIVGALGLGGYQLLADIGGVGAGRLGSQAFLLVAPEPDPALPDAGTQIALHHRRLRDERQLAAFVALAAALGYLRLSGYRLATERVGLRSRVAVVNPADGAVVLTVPERHPGGLLSLGGGSGADRLLAVARTLPAAGPRPISRTASSCARCCSRSPCPTRGWAGPRPPSSPTGRWPWSAATPGWIRRRRSRRPAARRRSPRSSERRCGR